MTEKELLLKDLCARLPYGVFVKDTYNGHYGRMYKISQGCVYYVSKLNCNYLESQPCYIKSYLRPMSSMTAEEEKEFREIKLSYHFDEDGYILFDWLNKHHFDYRGLIEKGLALEATEGMYK